MFYSFVFNGYKRAGKAFQESMLFTVGGVERHSLRIAAGVITHIAARDCRLISRDEARDIEREYQAFRKADMAERKAIYLKKVASL